MIEAKQPINCVALHPNQVFFKFFFFIFEFDLFKLKSRWTFLSETKTEIYCDGIFELVHWKT
jgi:hypothetical protein